MAQNESVHNPVVSRDGATLEIFIFNNSIDFLGSKLGAFDFNAIALLSLNVGLALLIFYWSQPIRRTLESGASIAQDRNITADLAAT
jgi:hypothetical protein